MTPQGSNLPLCIFCGKGCLVGYGFCHCGCGLLCKISAQNFPRYGYQKGKPRKFLWGHCGKINPKREVAIPFRVDGKPCRLIPLSRGQYAIVVAEHYDHFTERKWYARYDKRIVGHYAVRHTPKVNGKSSQIYMHREVMGLGAGDPLAIDHRDRMATLDNRPDNLRHANASQNGMNQKRKSNNTSGRKGVWFLTSRRKWISEIGFNGTKKYLGESFTFEDACAKRDAAEKKYHGEFARVE